ncbi:ferric reductase like transmembrane component-domain-containing protein [Ilyonectria robusta]|uniref:ferric reductase like transmembrane component-domain-containing protein n=1 Tax=Ilyonectria robusta TaxID=1079257 RepID=UPI001E8E89D9|nr:ferric reductase like transmembrane component-domain-containing protein [Ilyonectria robusta]KAH8656864.1 ferric reductase like transmembrane component-domain-containing protein [Ilyonectria robusta]
MIASTVLLLNLFCLVHNASAHKNGIVGFGISLYQDLCCQACHDSLSSLYLTCTTFTDEGSMSGMDMGDSSDMMGTTSADCYATNKAWLQTMAYCIQQNCNADGYPAKKQAKCFSNQAVAGASTPTFEDSLPAKAPTSELAGDAVWLNSTNLVNKDLYYATHGTLGEFARSEYLHTRYSVILYFIVIGICIAGGVIAQTASAFPTFKNLLQKSSFASKLRGYIFLPALFGSRRLEALPGHAGYIPGRTLSIFITIYIILNIIFSSVSFRNFQPNTWFLSPQFEMCEYVGNRTGTLSLVNMSIAILFAGRNNLLIALTGWSQTTFLTLHRWTARVAALQAVVHSIAYTLAYFEPGYDGASAYAAKAAESFYWWGIIATIALCLATCFAILPLRVKFYECFLILHIVLVILALIGSWYHIVPHFGYDYGYQVWLYIAFAFWAADRLARLLRIAYYNDFSDSKAIVEAVPGSNVMQVTVFPRVPWSFGPGQHSFLYIPELGKFWESHPFSVAGWTKPGQTMPIGLASASLSSSRDKEVNMVKDSPLNPTTITQRGASSGELRAQNRPSIRFMIRERSGMTSSLRRRLLFSPSGSNMKLSIFTEGPYAGHRATLHPLFITDTVLCIAGGVGITNILGYVQEYASFTLQADESQKKARGVIKKAKRFILAWSAREMSFIDHVKKNFLIDAEDIEYSFWCTGSRENSGKPESFDEGQKADNVTSSRSAALNMGRMKIESVLKGSVEHGQHTTVLVCGPGGMADEVTKQVVNSVKDGYRVDLIEEAFAW